MAKSTWKSNVANSMQMTMLAPQSDWTPPEVYPDLSDAKILAVDLETKGPHLTTKGPGGVRNDGYIVGICVATDTGFCAYYPIRHAGGGNLDVDITLRWLKRTLARHRGIVVGANFIYDLEWLACSGIRLGRDCIVRDVQILEGLLDEEGKYSLEALSRKYLAESKDEILLNEAAIAFGVNPKSGLWKLHSKYVGPYGEGDARNTLAVYQAQCPLLEREGLERISQLEHRVLPVVLEMRLKGVRVDLEAADNLNKKLLLDYEELLYGLKKETGRDINVWATEDLIRIAKAAQSTVVYTEKGNASFVKEWVAEQKHPLWKAVARARTLDRLRGTFIKGNIIDMAIDGRIHTGAGPGFCTAACTEARPKATPPPTHPAPGTNA